MDYYDISEKEAFLISLKSFIIKDKKLLLLKCTGPRSEFKGKWSLPGGLIDFREGLSDGLKREVFEETGLSIKNTSLFIIWDYYLRGFVLKDGRILNIRFIELGFKCNVSDERVKLSDEHNDYLWSAIKLLDKLEFTPDSDEGIRRYIKLMRSHK